MRRNVVQKYIHKYALYIVLVVLASAVSFLAQGCLFVSEEKKPEPPPVALPKPEIPMSEDYIRSKPGDMLAFIPKDWFLIDVEGKASSDVVAVAVNKDYTVSMIVQSIRKTDIVEQTVSKEGVIGLARLAFEKRSRKTAGTVRMLSTITTATMGDKTFGLYEFTADSATSTRLMRSHSAVFVSSINNYYECSLVPTTISAMPPPDEIEMNKTFRSILAALQF
ncbi:MAG: hypothetical protein U0Y96_03195 [Candidatus Kapaibacterium sp.]